MTKTTALRTFGAVLMACAVTPWIGAGAASAAANDDANCATRPAEVPAYATCVILDENTGENTAVHGETWAWRDADNVLHVYSYPTEPLSGSEPVQLCVRDTGAYPADFKCAGDSADRVFVGSDLTLDIPLTPLGITAAENVFYSIHVNQGERTTVSFGAPGQFTPTTTTTTAPPPPPPPPPGTSSAPVSVTPEEETSVEGTKSGRAPNVLPKTGSGMSLGMGLAVSLGLLLGGAALLFVPRRLALEKGQHRRH